MAVNRAGPSAKQTCFSPHVRDRRARMVMSSNSALLTSAAPTTTSRTYHVASQAHAIVWVDLRALTLPGEDSQSGLLRRRQFTPSIDVGPAGAIWVAGSGPPSCVISTSRVAAERSQRRSRVPHNGRHTSRSVGSAPSTILALRIMNSGHSRLSFQRKHLAREFT